MFNMCKKRIITEEANVTKLTAELKCLLKISDPEKYITYPYDNPDYLLEAKNFSDSSNDKELGAATAM